MQYYRRHCVDVICGQPDAFRHLLVAESMQEHACAEICVIHEVIAAVGAGGLFIEYAFDVVIALAVGLSEPCGNIPGEKLV